MKRVMRLSDNEPATDLQTVSLIGEQPAYLHFGNTHRGLREPCQLELPQQAILTGHWIATLIYHHAHLFLTIVHSRKRLHNNLLQLLRTSSETILDFEGQAVHGNFLGGQ